MLEQQIAELVAATNKLTGIVEGKIGEINQKVADAVAKLDQATADFQGQIPRIRLTRNQGLLKDPETNLPEGFILHGDVTATLHTTIAAYKEDRTSQAILLLDEIGTDLGADLSFERFYSDINVWSLTWSGTDLDYLGYPQGFKSQKVGTSRDYFLPTSGSFQVGAFVKLIAGDVGGYWAAGAVQDKWCFTGGSQGGPTFGRAVSMMAQRESSSGEILVALPAAITGYTEDPRRWFASIPLMGDDAE